MGRRVAWLLTVLFLTLWAHVRAAVPRGASRESSGRTGRLVWMPRDVRPDPFLAPGSPTSPIERRTWTRQKRPWHRVGAVRGDDPVDLGPLGNGRVWWIPTRTLDLSAALREIGTVGTLRSPWGLRLVRAGVLEPSAPVQEEQERLVVLGEEGLLEALDPLLDLRRRQGFAVEVVPVTSVGSDPSAIRSFLGFLARSESPPVGVLLVGDASDVPPARTRDGSPSDWILALPEEGAWVAAFPIARMPARGPEDVRTMVARILEWEQEVPGGPAGQWTARSVLVSSSEGVGGLDDDQVSERLAEMLLEVDQEPPDRLFHSLGTDRVDRLLAAFREGRGLVVHLGHGDGTSWSTMDPPFDRSAAATLANIRRTPLVIDVSCANGRFDLDESLAETLLHLGTPDAPAGAVAVVSATGDTPWDEPALLAQQILRALVSSSRPVLGEALERARLALVADRGPTVEVREVLEKTVLLGDPRVPFRAKAPSAMFVQAPSRAVPGRPWTARVREGPWPLAGVSVGIRATHGGSGRGVSGPEGIVSLPLAGGEGPWEWTATGPDRVPQTGSVVPGDSPCGLLEADPPVWPCVGRAHLRFTGWPVASPPVVWVRGGRRERLLTLDAAGEDVWEGLLVLGPGAFDDPGPLRVFLEGCPGEALAVPRDCDAPRLIAASWRMLDARRVEWVLEVDEESLGQVGVGPRPGVETMRRRDQGRWLRFVLPDRHPGEEAFLTVRLWDRAGNAGLWTGPEWSFRVPPCEPDCLRRTCGDDGCGGSCGPGCEAGQSCRDGRCTGGAGCAWWYLPGGGARCEECVCRMTPYCCTDRWDDACSWRCEALCGGCGTGCVPSCEGRECGDNGCGGTCGGCPVGSTCSTEGRCVPPCVPRCEGRECGEDGCGGSCGLCSDPRTGALRDGACREGRCVGEVRPDAQDPLPPMPPGAWAVRPDGDRWCAVEPDEETGTSDSRDEGARRSEGGTDAEGTGMPEVRGGTDDLPSEESSRAKGACGAGRRVSCSGLLGFGIWFLLARMRRRSGECR